MLRTNHQGAVEAASTTDGLWRGSCPPDRSRARQLRHPGSALLIEIPHADNGFLSTGEWRRSPMPRADNLYDLPKGLPVPVDDGACDHLMGMMLPSLPRQSTAGGFVDLASRPGTTVVYCYPRTGR